MLVLTLGGANPASRETLFRVPVGAERENRMTAPAGSSLVRNACVAPVKLSKPAVTGKPAGGAPAHAVEPVMYAAPVPSTAIALPTSVPAPPRYVEYTSAVPAAFSWVTNASRPPASAV